MHVFRLLVIPKYIEVPAHEMLQLLLHIILYNYATSM